MKHNENRSTKLKELLEKAQVTQRQLSDEVGVSERNINDWIRGVSIPRLDRAVAMSKSLGVSLKDLCEALGISVDGVPD